MVGDGCRGRLLGVCAAALLATASVLAAGCGAGSPTSRGTLVVARAATEGGHSDLYAAAADGSGSRLLVRNATDPAGSPDGESIAFARDGSIWIARRDGSHQRRLTTPPSGFVGDADPAWSPDGRRIYFTRADRRSNASLYVVGVGGGVRLLHEARPTPHVDCDEHPAVSPDGSTVAFAHDGDCEHWSSAAILGVGADGRRVSRGRLAHPTWLAG